MTAPTFDQLISRPAAVKQLGVHPNTLDRAVRSAGIKRYRVLGDPRVYYRKDDIGAIQLVQPIEEA